LDSRGDDVSEQGTPWTLTVGDNVLPVRELGRGYYHGGLGAPWSDGPGILDSITLGIRGIPHAVYVRLESTKVVLRGPDNIDAPGRVQVMEAGARGREPWDAEMRFNPDSWADLTADEEQG
jgi:hypothetical protein